MKVTLDLDRLLAEEKITRQEYEKFSQFSSRSTRHTALNILIGFGIVAVAGALMVLFPTPVAAIGLGLAIGAGGMAGMLVGTGEWRVLAEISLLVGAVLVGGGIVVADEGSIAAFAASAAIFAGAGIVARSTLLVVLAVLALSSCLGARTGYLHATYFLGIEQPALTVVVFSVLAVAFYQAARRLPSDWQDVAMSAARTSVFLVNLGFWIGSLWGDRLGASEEVAVVPPLAFSLIWALAIVGAGVWAARANRRWLVNVAAVFGAIHFYTQGFEALGASPLNVLLAGLIALAIAVALSVMNKRWASANA